MKPPVCAILAGGQSRRMGRDKAQIVWQGETLLQRTVRVAEEAGCAVIVAGREPPPDWPWPRTQFVRDLFPEQGPLGGLATVLHLAESPVMALACDMPLLTAETLRWLWTQPPDIHGVAVKNGAHWEPLFSVYTPAVLPLLESHLASGRRSLQELFRVGTFCPVVAPTEIAAVLVNVNTQEEWGNVQRDYP
jgi:molybdopterin-guanine dinucleotide biosynthesis protein A